VEREIDTGEIVAAAIASLTVLGVVLFFMAYRRAEAWLSQHQGLRFDSASPANDAARQPVHPTGYERLSSFVGLQGARLTLRWWRIRGGLWAPLLCLQRCAVTLAVTSVIFAGAAIPPVRRLAAQLPPHPPEFLIGVGTAIAAILTIGISLGLIVIQRAAEGFSRGMLKAMTTRRFNVVAFMVLSTLSVSTLAAGAADPQSLAARWLMVGYGTFAIAVSFDLLRELYRETILYLDGHAAMAFMHARATNELEAMTQAARLYQKAYLADVEPAGQSLAAAIAFSRVAGYRERLERWFADFAEDATRASQTGRLALGAFAVECLGSLLLRVMQSREQDAFFTTRPDHLLMRECDIQPLLERGYERLSEVGSRAIQAQDIPTSVGVSRILAACIVQAGRIRDPYHGDATGLIIAPLSTFSAHVQRAIEAKEFEIPFQSVTELARAVDAASTASGSDFVASDAVLLYARTATYYLSRREFAIANSATALAGHATVAVMKSGDIRTLSDRIQKLLTPIDRLAREALKIETAQRGPFLPVGFESLYASAPPSISDSCRLLANSVIQSDGTDEDARRLAAIVEGLRQHLRDLLAAACIVGTPAFIQILIFCRGLLEMTRVSSAAAGHRGQTALQSMLEDSHRALISSMTFITRAPCVIEPRHRFDASQVFDVFAREAILWATEGREDSVHHVVSALSFVGRNPATPTVVAADAHAKLWVILQSSKALGLHALSDRIEATHLEAVAKIPVEIAAAFGADYDRAVTEIERELKEPAGHALNDSCVTLLRELRDDPRPPAVHVN